MLFFITTLNYNLMLNDNKTSYGMFSRAGIQTTEKYHILMKKDDILNGKTKKHRSKSMFDPEVVVSSFLLTYK